VEWFFDFFKKNSMSETFFVKDGLPDFNPKWYNPNPNKIANNLHLKNRYIGKEFIIAGAGPSISRFDHSFRKNKVVMSLCGAQELVKGDIYIPTSDPVAWNGMKNLIGSGQTVFMSYTYFNKKFVKIIKSYGDLNCEWFSYYTAPSNNMKWYSTLPPYNVQWYIDKKGIPHNTGPQSAALAISLAIFMGAKNIFIVGVDGFFNLLKDGKPIYKNEFAEQHYKFTISTDEKRNHHLLERGRRDAADRYIFSQLFEYCKSSNIGIFLLNTDSHLVGTLPLAGKGVLV